VTVPVQEGLFTDEPRLLGSRCTDCGGHHFPRHETCPYCASDAVEPIELSPTGRLWAWTAVTAAPPGYEGAVPFGFGVVELSDGVRVITRLVESEPGRLRAGDAMRLVLVPLSGEVVTYAFEAMA
jgi:uncharacterized OB-fold protein